MGTPERVTAASLDANDCTAVFYEIKLASRDQILNSSAVADDEGVAPMDQASASGTITCTQLGVKLGESCILQ